jgi:ribosomal protein S18 acetylase RimI-like enzyme
MSRSDLRYRDLAGIPEEALLSAFNEAFADYQVKMTFTLDDLRAMHVRRGVSYPESLGAFDGERLVGFIFNGAGPWEGRRCAYDAGTGVLPSHRGIGLSKDLAAKARNFLAALGFQRWLLEVLVENEKAIRTYEGAGFQRTRRFTCPEGRVLHAAPRAEAACTRASVALRDLGHRDTARFAAFRAWEPSWQNSDASVARTPEPLVALGAFEPGTADPCGYVVANAKGSICQLAVRPEARRRGVGTALLCGLAARTPEAKLRYINIQSDDAATLGLLAALGIGSSLDQWEMLLEL